MTDLDLAGEQASSSRAVAERPDRRLRQLHRELREAGLLERQHLYYGLQMCLLVLALAVGAAAFLTVGDSWWQIPVAIYFGLCWTHIGFLGHDISHRQVAAGRRATRLLGLVVGNVVLGFSYGGFARHHNTHHVYPNHVDRDPDIARRQILLTPDRGTPRSRVERFVLRHRVAFFMPVLVAESLALRVATLREMPRHGVRTTLVEGALVGVHFAAYMGALVLLLPPAKAVMFALVQQVIFGLYTEMVIAPNHKAMPVQTPPADWDWLARQLMTSRNLGTSRLTSFVYGGQNFHIEHHLFPAMPRNNARQAAPIVKAFCQKHSLPYHTVSVRNAFVELLRS